MSVSRYYIALMVLAASPVMASAQSITESVTVEGRYTPDIIPADRLALLPDIITLTAPESPMNYDRKGVTAAFAPDALSMPATGWRAKKAYDASRGYIDLRLGSWLNSSLSAGFTPIRNEDTRLNIYLQHNSTSLWQAWKENEETDRPAADHRYRYDETIGANLSHRLPGAGTLTGGLQYHLEYFNYYGTDQGPDEDGHIKAPNQTLNDVYAHAGWIGEDHGRLTYSADADVRHFAYRAMYVPLLASVYPREYAVTKGERETAVNIGGNVKYSLSDESGNGSSIGIGIRYSGVLNSIGNDVNRIEATPAYTLSGRNYTLRLGANLAVVGNGCSTRFRVAPDVRFSARKGLTAFSASIGGGTHLRTLAWRHMMNYYADPTAGCYQAAYSPLEIRLALQLNPGGRWTLGVEGLWNTTLDESFGGLYQALLNNSLSAYDSYPAGGRIHGFSIAVNAGYEFSRYLSLKAKASGQPQNDSKGILNGFDRPKLTADISAESSPVDNLSLKLDYRLRAKRQFHLGRLSRLDLSADYRITDRISVGLEVDNILNKHQEILPGLALEGLNVLGGVQVVF
ncbi:MAG: hypothetical protein K2H22_01655 [Muribaculaceae bacterium]|nr:hypothetical protein [Muribaculaceae bacterium]